MVIRTQGRLMLVYPHCLSPFPPAPIELPVLPGTTVYTVPPCKCPWCAPTTDGQTVG